MRGKERVTAVMKGQPYDQRPFCPLLSLYGAKLTECSLRTYYTDPASYSRGQQAVAETFHPDVLLSPFFMAGFGEAFGGELRYFEKQPPNLARPAISSIYELPDLNIPDPDSHPSLVYQREALRNLVIQHGQETIIAASLLGPFDLPIMIMGLESWLEIVLCDPGGVKQMLDVTTPFFLKWIEILIAEGADALVLPSPFLTPAILTCEVAERIVLPALRGIYDQLPCPVILHSVGGPFMPLLKLLGKLPNIGGAVVDEGEDLVMVRDVLGPGRILFGGLDGGLIWRRTPEELRVATHQILNERKDDLHFVFTATGPDVDWRTTPEQLHAILSAISEDGCT
ncbi:MAG: hypothetical protein KAR44_01830 [Candidatus Aegiribacteria sp.]|nr:hypothetical protein [Candidatus Aegiribacteria sp.]